MSKTATEKQFSLLIKPASADCNLACAYCFYLSKSGLYPNSARHRMSERVLERIVSSYLSTEQSIYSFGWQGGEPMLMGVEFFRKVVELQSHYGRPGSVVANGLQTNATLITEELARLFSEYRFLLGVSLDGPEEIHNTCKVGRCKFAFNPDRTAVGEFLVALWVFSSCSKQSHIRSTCEAG
jgi:uncharacterized protein